MKWETVEEYEAWMTAHALEIDEWLTRMRAAKVFGPGCGNAEFEGVDWRDQVRARFWNRPWFARAASRAALGGG